jgi:hypothetical protein
MQIECYPTRDRSYGIWHRSKSIARFLKQRQANALTMADLDSVLFAEYDYPNKLPLCLIEVGQDIGQEKSTGVITNLARLANIPAYVALYSHAEHQNPTNTNWPDINRFRIKRLWPQPEQDWRTLTPEQWAKALVQIRSWQLRRFNVQEAANDPMY